MRLQDLLKLADAYCAHVGRSDATVSNQITTHARLFRRLRQGQGCNVSTYLSALIWFSENWPTDLEWPADIERPASKTASKGAA
ncbi:hypothetical protein [Mameliella sp.]|uniref:hypothetical protein n=1 Tax=Mameliella sp. TaxID=1924940 RepID=UPI003B5048C4